MNLFGVLEVSASALLAERQRAEVVASNMANSETTRTAEGGPYRRQMVVFRSATPASFGDSLGDVSFGGSSARGVEIAQVVPDPTPPIRRFDPSHPDADADGYVSFPAINPVQEMADLMGAVRAYQMNTSAVEATKNLIQMSLDLGRV